MDRAGNEALIIAPSETGINLADDRDLIVRSRFFCTIKIWTVRVMRPCPENKWPFSPALQNAWESLDYKANIGPVTNKEDSDQPAYPRCQHLVCLHQ